VGVRVQLEEAVIRVPTVPNFPSPIAHPTCHQPIQAWLSLSREGCKIMESREAACNPSGQLGGECLAELSYPVSTGRSTGRWQRCCVTSVIQCSPAKETQSAWVKVISEPYADESARAGGKWVANGTSICNVSHFSLRARRFSLCSMDFELLSVFPRYFCQRLCLSFVHPR
jgi:hypothetical protein